ncbi:hypothetical protein A4X13_0g8278, partial [Tilletia indica]
MTKLNDALSSITTAALRSLAVAYFHKRGASGMSRSELVPFFLDHMREEELDRLHSATRRATDPSQVDIHAVQHSIHRSMRERYGTQIMNNYLASQARAIEPRLQHMEENPPPSHPGGSEDQFVEAAIGPEQPHDEDRAELEEAPWPRPITQQLKDECVSAFRTGTALQACGVCAVCARRVFNKDILFVKNSVSSTRFDPATLDLEVLRITDPHILERPGQHFEFDDSSLDGLALDRKGVHTDINGTQLDICGPCHSALSKSPPRLPTLALANGNIRGTLPEHLQDCTWLEERLCARYLASACVVRLYDLTSPGAPEHRSRVMKGHACSFPLNTVATATKLPWTVADGGPLLSCIVIGPRKPRIQDLRAVFKVRRQKVKDLLDYLKANAKDYPQWEDDPAAIAALPEDDVPELIMRSVYPYAPTPFSVGRAGTLRL